MWASLRIWYHFRSGPGSRSPTEYQFVQVSPLAPRRPASAVRRWNTADPPAPTTRPTWTRTASPGSRRARTLAPGAGRSGAGTSTSPEATWDNRSSKTRVCCSPRLTALAAASSARRSLWPSASSPESAARAAR